MLLLSIRFAEERSKETKRRIRDSEAFSGAYLEFCGLTDMVHPGG
jgi:hypothetical protein